MAKLAPHVFEDPPPRRRPRQAAVAIASGLALAPLVFEASAAIAARWRAMYGPLLSVETPALDAVGQAVRGVLASVRATVSPVLNGVPWKPAVVIPLCCAWGVCCCLLLRWRAWK